MKRDLQRMLNIYQMELNDIEVILQMILDEIRLNRKEIEKIKKSEE